ncbi:hypothetical protein BG004_001743 [Podila humilis]|nr:hypothetical protein BG004_001743 [Podila humilis]
MLPVALPSMPENIWLDIFGYLSLDEKFRIAGTCRTWHRILADPSLYTHITLDCMEFNTLVLCMKQLCRLAPRIRSFHISNCFSHFISKTTVPVQNTSIMHYSPQHPGMHSLYTHITSFTPARRREEYRKLGFTLHQDFSSALVALMEHSQDSIKRLEIHDNFLDLEMTELIFCIVRYGRHLEHLLYDANKDGGFVAPEVVSAITAACPNIKSFRGQHAISNTVLRRMMTGWEGLQSVTLSPYESRDLGTKEVTLEGLWSLLECGKIESLEILDLNCISNIAVQTMVDRVTHLRSTNFQSPFCSTLNHPFAHHATFTNSNMVSTPATASKPIPGETVRNLILTKYTSTPLTLPGFAALLKLFPNLQSFSFTTNFCTYDHQFQGLSKDIYQEEITMVERLVLAEMSDRWGAARSGACWKGTWHAAVTEEQRLRTGILRSG